MVTWEGFSIFSTEYIFIYSIYYNCNDNVLTKIIERRIVMNKEMVEMTNTLNVTMAPKDSTFQVRINSEIKRKVEEIYARTGMTLTDAFNTFIQQSINVEGLPFLVTQNSKDTLREQAIALLMMDLKRAEERADKEGWIDAEEIERELGVLD